MRFERVSRIPNAHQYLAAPHTICDLHAQPARLQVEVVGELTVTDVERDRVTGGCIDHQRCGAAFAAALKTAS
jgi:hypothetical protein